MNTSNVKEPRAGVDIVRALGVLALVEYSSVITGFERKVREEDVNGVVMRVLGMGLGSLSEPLNDGGRLTPRSFTMAERW
ncbi:hypothetical protein F3Y22_tig00117017pilonHSYRG00238 [Hibiscus syriacus]|uniref:Uncharacterized protein n=1 Tax=Hibiscus syriacus TaxID=106335 RepID=A0A6A2XPH4_HIBSY|nr:hypothetical protein F3Y22_tig00117017pilonHSYRG00238 [Hibiscus syriacus]